MLTKLCASFSRKIATMYFIGLHVTSRSCSLSLLYLFSRYSDALLHGREFGGLVCADLWGHKTLDLDIS